MEPPVVALTAYLLILLIGVCRAEDNSNYISNTAVKKDEDRSETEVDLEGATSPEPTVGEEPCPPEKPMRCKNTRRCYSKKQKCNGKNNCGDETDEIGCRSRGWLGIGWPWYHWVLACAFGGAACILAVYGVYLMIDRRRMQNQQDQFRIDRDSLDGGGTPVRFVNRDAQTKYNAINQDSTGLR